MIAKSFARIHIANLINAGILPLTFENAEDYDIVAQGSRLSLKDIYNALEVGKLTVTDIATGWSFTALCDLTQRQRNILRCGGLLNYTKEGGL